MDDSQRLYVILTTNASTYRREMRGAGTDTRQFGQDADEAAGSTRRLSTEVNSVSGRLGILLDTLALVGPAAVPIGAIAVPALSGLASVSAAAVGGIAAVAIAFAGLGDALGAVRDYELEPTAENLMKARQELAKLPPAAQDAVMALNDMAPVLQRIRAAAASGFFPGLLEGLDEVETVIPRVSQMLREYGEAAGDVASELGSDLSSSRARKFFRFVQAEAKPAVSGLYETVGNLAGGMAELWQVMDPANDDFLDWMVDASGRFDKWAQDLRRENGAQEFLDYLHDTGPEVAETTAAIADAVLQILEAAAPMGGVALDGLELAATAIGNIADSPLGPTIFAGLAAVTLLNRSLQATAGLMTKAGMTGPGGQAVSASPGGVWGAFTTQGDRARTTVRGFTGDLGKMRQEYARSNPAVAVMRSGLSGTSDAAKRARTNVAAAGKAAAGGAIGMGALAVMSTEAGQSLGLTNTALFGMIGAMRGPWGAAIGASVGLVSDAVAEHNRLEDAIDAVTEAAGDADFRRMRDNLAEVNAAFEDSLEIESVGDVFDSVFKGLGAAIGSNEWRYGDYITEQNEKAERAALDFEQAVGQIGLALDENFGKDEIGRSVIPSLEELQAVADSAEPAMRKLGITWDELADMDSTAQRQAAEDIRRMMGELDSGPARMREFGSAVDDLGNDALSTAESADQLRNALDALLSPTLDAEAAFDAWRQAIKDLRTELKADAGFVGNTEGARDNRAMTRDYVDTMKDRLETLAALTTTTEKDMARAVAQTREEFIDAGVAAGFSRDQMVARANAMKLTPKLVRTVFEAAGITDVELKARALADQYKRLPKKLQTEVAANGIPKTVDKINELVEKYDLTDEQRTALITIRDLASKDIEGVIGLLEETDGKRPNPDVSANTAPARSALAALLEYLRGVDGTTATTTVYTKRVTIGGAQPSTPGEPTPPRLPTQPRRVTPSSTRPQAVFPGGGGSTTVIRHSAPLIGSVTVPEAVGETDGRAHRAASAIVREASFAARSGRWSSEGDD